MPRTAHAIAVYFETGSKKTIIGAIDWPGWARIARDEASAFGAFLDYAPRYARVLKGTRLGFHAPADATDIRVVERLQGNAATDFGVPNVPASFDLKPLSAAEHRRLQTLLRAGWRAFDRAVAAARGRELRKGPRGGGRDLDRIVQHVNESEQGYLSALGWKFKPTQPADQAAALRETRQAVLAGLAAAMRGEIPARGPRGGKRWTPRQFVRRLAWHTLDHLWEIEDRVT